MKNKTVGDLICSVGGSCWSMASAIALLIWLDIEPSWRLIIWLASIGFGLIVVGGIVDGTREAIREIREGRL